jgi:hypothetical protein
MMPYRRQTPSLSLLAVLGFLDQRLVLTRVASTACITSCSPKCLTQGTSLPKSAWTGQVRSIGSPT